MSETINFKLQSLLRKKKMTQKELAEITNITESAISRYINGDRVPRGVNLVKIAQALDISTDELLDNVDNNKQNNDFKSVKALIARSAKEMTLEEKMEIIAILTGKGG